MMLFRNQHSDPYLASHATTSTPILAGGKEARKTPPEESLACALVIQVQPHSSTMPQATLILSVIDATSGVKHRAALKNRRITADSTSHVTPSPEWGPIRKHLSVIPTQLRSERPRRLCSPRTSTITAEQYGVCIAITNAR